MNNYFCVLPFFGYEFWPVNNTHCCLLPKNYNIDVLRKSIIDGKRSDYCSKCWNLEDNGLQSDRVLKNAALDFYWDRDIKLIEEDVKQGKYKPLMIKNITSNTCNSTCVTCNSYHSTAWAPLEKRLNIIPCEPRSMTQDDITKNLNFKELLSLNLLGGEPLYEKLNFYIIEQLLAHGNDKCFIQLTTNGSVILSESNKELLKKFKNINFNISIDGIGPIFEYMRFPLKWKDAMDNLDFFRSITNNVSVSYTISNLNVLYHHNTIDWFKKEHLNYHFNPVDEPKHFRPSALPKIVKEEIFKKYGHTKDLTYFIGGQHTDDDDTDFAKMLDIISKQDVVKGISYKDYLPEFANLLSLVQPTSI